MNKVFIILGWMLVAAACTTTVTRRKQPVFAESVDSLAARLNQLVTCQHFNADGSEVTTNGKKKTELELDVINGKDIPEGDLKMALARKLGVELKKALKDTGEYDEYKILFMKVKVSGGLTSRSWEGKVFKSSELQ
jgi:hypothetical protein